MNFYSKMEKIIFGTHLIPNNKLKEAITNAYKNGIRNFDTAQLYNNEQLTSESLKQYNDVNISTKIRKISKNQEMIQLIEKSQERISENHLTTILLHRPMPLDSWKTLEKFGKKYTIGVSNYNVQNLEYLKKHSDKLPIRNQIEFHPFCPDSLEILGWCKENGIVVYAHTILANTKFFTNPLIAELSKKYNVSPAQIMMKWAYQHGVHMVLSTTEEHHIIEWKSVLTDDFCLTKENMTELNNLSKTSPHRFYDNSWTPWFWNEKVVNNDSVLIEEIKKLQLDIEKVNSNEYISDLALLIPSVKKSEDDMEKVAKFIAEYLFPAKKMKNKNKLNFEDSHIKYNKCLKKLKNKIHKQRKIL